MNHAINWFATKLLMVHFYKYVPEVSKEGLNLISCWRYVTNNTTNTVSISKKSVRINLKPSNIKWFYQRNIKEPAFIIG